MSAISRRPEQQAASDAKAHYRNAAAALTRAQNGILDSREALGFVGQRHAALRLDGFVHYVGEMRRLLREQYAEMAGEAEAAKIFEIPSSGQSGGRHTTKKLK